MPGPLKTFEERRQYSNVLRIDLEAESDQLVELVLSEAISLEEFQREMRDLIRRANKLHFITGKGGVADEIFVGDYGVLGTPVREQYKFLQKFIDKIAEVRDANGSLNFIQNRARLYMRTAQASFWRAAVPVQIPQVPRDGKTECRSNCKCNLDIQYENDENGRLIAVLVYWNLANAEHCEDCVRLDKEWNPLRLPVTSSQSSLKQAIKLLFIDCEPSLREAQVMLEVFEGVFNDTQHYHYQPNTEADT